jgi:hypothetical protein
MAVTSAVGTAGGVLSEADVNAFWVAVELELKVPRRRNIAEGFSFESLQVMQNVNSQCSDR